MKEIPAYLQRDCHWMRQALEEAHKAAELHEIPVGAVIVYQNEIIARAHNRRELDQDALAPRCCASSRPVKNWAAGD